MKEAGEEPALVGVGAHDERNAVRSAVPHRPHRIPGQELGVERRPDHERAAHLLHRVPHDLFERVDQLRGPSGHHGGRAVGRRHPEHTGQVVGERGGDLRRPRHAACRTLRDRPCKQSLGFGNRKQRGDGMRACALAEDRHVVRVATEHGRVVANPAQRHHQVAQKQVVIDRNLRCRQCRQIHAAERTQPIVHRHVHATTPGERRSVEDRGRRATQDVTATVDEEHHRQRTVGLRLGRHDVQREAVLAHGLISANAEEGVLALLRRAIRVPVAVANARPGSHRLGRAEAQPAHRRTSERNRPPAVHTVTGEALDGAAVDADANRAFVHGPTVAKNSPARRA